MQRLFSNFANGWPGAGLLLQRGLAGFLLLYNGIVPVWEKLWAVSAIPEEIGAAAGVFLLLGLWTPVTGTVAAMAELWVLLTGTHEPWMGATLATLSATLAMIGPGAWSCDARIFGRKHIEARWPSKRGSGLFH